MKKIFIPFMMLGLLLSCTGEAQENLDTYRAPDGRIHVHKKMVTIYLTSRLLRSNDDRVPKYGYLLFDSNGDFDTIPEFTTYFIYEKKNNTPGVIMWQNIPNSGVTIDKIVPKYPDMNILIEGTMDCPPFVITLSKHFLDSLCEKRLSHREEYIIEWSLDGHKQPNIEPPIDIKPPDE